MNTHSGTQENTVDRTMRHRIFRRTTVLARFLMARHQSNVNHMRHHAQARFTEYFLKEGEDNPMSRRGVQRHDFCVTTVRADPTCSVTENMPIYSLSDTSSNYWKIHIGISNEPVASLHNVNLEREQKNNTTSSRKPPKSMSSN